MFIIAIASSHDDALDEAQFIQAFFLLLIQIYIALFDSEWYEENGSSSAHSEGVKARLMDKQ